MSLGTSNRDGGKTSENGHLRSIYKALIAEVLSGLNVTQRGAGANMSVDIQVGDAVLPRSDGTYGHPVFNDAVLNKTVTAADVSNPRRDIVIMYLDYGVSPSTAVSNNTNGVVLTKVVAGTAAGSPVDPNPTALQAAAGSGNPYIKLARIRVGAGVGTISNSVIDDLRKMAHGLSQGGWIYDPTYDWVYGSASTFTVAGVDVTAQFPVGTKIALYQSGSIKYFVVTDATFSTDTTVTVDGFGTYTLANVPIDRPSYSYELTPVGFPNSSVQTYNPYKFSVYRSAAFNAPSPVGKVNFDTETFDTNGNFDSTTNFRYVAPIDGFYHLESTITTGSTSGTGGAIFIYKNGSLLKKGSAGLMPTTSGFTTAFTVSGLVELDATDYVEIWFVGDSGQPIITGAPYSFFDGHLVSVR